MFSVNETFLGRDPLARYAPSGFDVPALDSAECRTPFTEVTISGGGKYMDTGPCWGVNLP
ncbi:MAG: hypothetical protein OXE52_02595 [Chloroflexi bacterium]|nr:hypothetical protein [Chloroflexota bacterium]